MGKLRYPNGVRFEPFDQVMRRRLAIERGIHREDDLIDVAAGDSRYKRVDAQILRTNAIERRESPAKNVEPARKKPRPLKRPKIGNILHHAEHARITARIGAYSTRAGCINVSADLARRERFVDPFQRTEQGRQRPFALFQQIKHRAPRRTRPQSREPRERLHQCFDLLACHCAHDRGLRIVLPRG